MRNALHDLFTGSDSKMINRATILKDGNLTPDFKYLKDYLNFAG
jgi:hypothetical protein